MSAVAPSVFDAPGERESDVGALAAEGPSFAFYRDEYGGILSPAELAEAMPAALRCVRRVCGGAGPRPAWSDEDVGAWCRAACAAAEAIAEHGEACAGGWSLGSLRVTDPRGKRREGHEVARDAALAELAGSGLAFSGAGR